VKRVSGKTLAVFQQGADLRAARDEDTSIFDDHTQVIPRHATGYTPRDGGGFKVEASNREMTGEGNIQSTIEDLARWTGTSTTASGRAARGSIRCVTPGKLDDGTPLTYAMDSSSRRRAASPKRRTPAVGRIPERRPRYPTERLSVFCLCNRNDVDPIALTKAVVKHWPRERHPEAPRSGTSRASAATSDMNVVRGRTWSRTASRLRTFVVKDGGLYMGLRSRPSRSRRRSRWSGSTSGLSMPGYRRDGCPNLPAGKTPARVSRVRPERRR